MSTKKYIKDEFFNNDVLRPLMDLMGAHNQREFAAILGITYGNITNAKSKKKIPNTWPDKMVAKKEGLSRDDIAKIIDRGKEIPKMDNGVPTSAAFQVVEENQVFVANAEKLDLPEVFKAILELKRSWFMAEFPENFRDLLVWVMDSDNMAPTINYRDLLIIDAQIEIHRVMRRMDGAFDMINDNRAYPSWNMSVAGVQIMGRVIRVMKQI